MRARHLAQTALGRCIPALLALAVIAEFGQSFGTVGAMALRTAVTCPPAPGVKPLIRGLVDRNVAPPAPGLQASSINVGWNTLEHAGPGLVAGNPIDQAIAAGGCTPLRVRVLAGTATPGWVEDATGGPVSVINPYSDTAGSAGRFWSSEYGVLYDNLEAELAAAYEHTPTVVEFVVSRCALFYPEPFLLGTSIATNDTNLLAAGYTEAADQQCLQEEIDTANADWPTTRVGVSFNPYQTLVPSSTAKGYTVGVDEAYTEQMMAYCRTTLGTRCVLENDSIRDPISSVGGSTPYYGEMYAAMFQLGAPIAFQTATAANIGDFWGTLEWARAHHAASVELPVDGTYPLSGGAGAPAWQTLAEVAAWFQDVPAIATQQINAIQGTSTAGDVIGTITVDEGAAFDTQVPYGDVGSIPFDTASAVITWPSGAIQAGLVAIGGGSPASSVTCGIAAVCTVTVFSSGYTFPEQVVSGPASVAVTLSAGGVPYTPADGVALVAPAPVTVTPAPLTLVSLTVTPARSAPTASLSTTFADADPLGVAADYQIQIKWGDGKTSSVAAKVSGNAFSAGASHRYAHTGKFTVTLTIVDVGGATVSGSRSITVR